MERAVFEQQKAELQKETAIRNACVCPGIIITFIEPCITISICVFTTVCIEVVPLFSMCLYHTFSYFPDHLEQLARLFGALRVTSCNPFTVIFWIASLTAALDLASSTTRSRTPSLSCKGLTL